MLKVLFARLDDLSASPAVLLVDEHSPTRSTRLHYKSAERQRNSHQTSSVRVPFHLST